MTTKLERLLEKEAQLKAQIQQAKAAERTLEKKRDTRRKILVGAAVMARVENGKWPKEDLLSMMDGFLSRPNERELFGLAVDEKDAAVNGAASSQKKAVAGSKATASQKAVKKKRTVKPLPEPNTDDDIDNPYGL
ncbi:hypothetical protein S7335_890 [Synechococcus sp. PCC 7335]|uniref:hypothetical protein n=1 Tax=Synechococcus sp. (strain ATCC 29403 / PCC 7335) TaxID=91464 RepID=UPI00017EC49F|nr:hypothetical protein [Synechococcus sp. PCC 7335]EDX82333.1 hypothetical protein S7335_890 [Synechococcus sp. PCC 7335]